MNCLVVITNPRLAIGFQLAGVRTYGVSDAAAAEALLASLLQEGEAGLVAIDEVLLAGVSAATRQRLEATEHPSYITIPAGSGPAAGSPRRQLIAETISRATGYGLGLTQGRREARDQ